jgi:lambda family phage minor tail protein L
MPELNGPTFERLVHLYELDLTAYGEETYRFIDTTTFEADLPELGMVTWRGNDYQPYPITASGFQRGGENLIRPSIAVPDFSGAIYTILRTYEGGYGAPINRYTALAGDIEDNSPFAPFIVEEYVINSVSRESLAVGIQLATRVDFAKRKVPGIKMERIMYPGLGSAIQRS